MGEVNSGGSPPAGLRVLLAASDDDQAEHLRRLLTASTTPPFEVVHAANGWEAQRESANGTYAALVLDDSLADIGSETLLGRLRATGVVAPALFLTRTDADQTAATDRLPRAEALTGRSLVRAIVALIQRHDLTSELAAARTALAELTHDLATPLGVVVGMTQLLLADDYGLNDDGRELLDDVALGAARACEIIETLNATGRYVQAAPDAGTGSVMTAARGESARNVVLIADDDPATRRLVRATLASDQYSVLEAADGEEAWRLIRQHHPSVAILDWQMPVYSGLELTDVIKSDPQVWGMTVIMLTGRTTAADREAGARARADLYVTKPFSTEELLGAVERALGIVH